jgi:gluconate 2-dehydrogenase
MKPRIVVYKKLPEALLAKLQAAYDVVYFESINDHNRAEFLAALPTAQGLLGASVKISPEMLADAHALKIISTISVGVDQFDLDYLRQRQILLAHTPGVLTESTADTVFAMILATARRVVELAEYVKAGKWQRSIGESEFGVNVHGKTIGLLGMGRIGSAVARRAHHGFGMNVIYHNTRPNPEAEASLNARYVDRETLFKTADFVCVMLPLTATTQQSIGLAEFKLMKPTGIFINASRGKVVKENELIQALQEKIIYAAGLDVFEVEPLPVSSPLLQCHNVVALPHIGSATHETRLAMAELAVENLIAGLEGGQPRNLAI